MQSPPVKYTLGLTSRIEPKTLGEPGRRTFNLELEAGPALCTVWLEKELLLQLGIRLQETVARLPTEEKQRPSNPVDPQWTGEELTLDFKAGQLSLEYNSEANSFNLLAFEVEDEESSEERASVSFWITPEQAVTLAEEALRICAAGRPRCFLCGLPIDPDGHICPRSNGHTVFEAG